MLMAKDFRMAAWDKFKNNMGVAVLATLVSFMLCGAAFGCSFFIFGLGILVVLGPLALGLSMISLSVIGGKQVKFEQLFNGIKNNYFKSFMLGIKVYLPIFLWSLLFIVPGIIKACEYSMSFFILAENPDLSDGEARARSSEIMKDNKWRLFCLYCSFAGWILLGLITGGIMFIFVSPYMKTAKAEFYRSLIPEHIDLGYDPFDGEENASDRTSAAADAIFSDDEETESDRTAAAAEAIFSDDEEIGEEIGNGNNDNTDNEDNDSGEDSGDDKGDDDLHNRNYEYIYMNENSNDDK